jgi:hypothetical protein
MFTLEARPLAVSFPTMDIGSYVGLALFAIGGALSIAIWSCGFFFRRRLRGPVRILMMSVFLGMWYLALWPLTSNQEYSEWLTQPARLGIHSIWIWWAIAMVKIERQIRREVKRSNFKTGVIHATGVHIVRMEREASKARQQQPPPQQNEPGQKPELEI